ncbi:hypothetical protein AAE478_007287 [Parahypoxylon ruwenzoriense]
MARHSRKREKHAVDYRHRWPTQQTLFESRDLNEGGLGNGPKSRRIRALEVVSIPLLWINTKIESWQENIGRRVEFIEEQKRERPSVTSLSESLKKRRFIPADTRPGQSTHPYDTGVGGATGTEARNSNQTRQPSFPIERSTTSREHTPTTLDRFRRASRVKSVPNLFQYRKLPTTPGEGNRTNLTLESQAENSCLDRHRDRLRSHRRSRHRRKGHSISSQDVIQMISRSSTELGVRRETQKIRWWQFNKPGCKQIRRDVDNISAPVKGVSTQDEDDRIARPEPGRSGQEPPTMSGPKEWWQRRRSISSSRAHPSTAGTDSPPGNMASTRNFADEDPGTEASSPMPPTQLLRLWLSSGRSPSPREITQLDVRGPRTTTPISTTPVGRPSMESRLSSRSRAWVEFRAAPRPQPDALPSEDIDRAPRRQDKGRGLSWR